MFNQGIKDVDFVVCNTDAQALASSPVPTKIQLGVALTEGLGAGSIPEIGQQAALEDIDTIKQILGNNTKMVFITAGMGGGTGTGACPVIASIARELGVLTVGIVTVPFAIEGKKRKIQAEKGIEELKKHVDSILVICNDKIREIYGNLGVREAFSKADNVLTAAAKGIAELITVEGYINVDFNDINTVMKNSGVALMGNGIAEGEHRAIKAAEMALASPLLNDNNIIGAKDMLLYISSGTHEITMDEIGEITEYIVSEAGEDVNIIMGNGTDESLGEKVSITLIVTGFDVSGEIIQEKRRLPLEEIIGAKTENTVKEIKETAMSSAVVSGVSNKLEVDRLEPVLKTSLTEEVGFGGGSYNTPVFNKEEGKRIVHELGDLDAPVPNKVMVEEVKESVADLVGESIRETMTSVPEEKEAAPVYQTYMPAMEVELEVENKVIEHTDFTHPDLTPDQRAQIRKDRLKQLSVRLKTKTISDIENEPAYKRNNIQLDAPIPSDESRVSRYALGVDAENNGSLRPNSFLHDNVD
jgi:cell division protein FtsZ